VCRIGYTSSTIGGVNSSLKRKGLPFKIRSAPDDVSWAGKDLYLVRIGF
jgi:hypothetical protein